MDLNSLIRRARIDAHCTLKKTFGAVTFGRDRIFLSILVVAAVVSTLSF